MGSSASALKPLVGFAFLLGMTCLIITLQSGMIFQWFAGAAAIMVGVWAMRAVSR